MIKKIDTITLYVKDPLKSVEFYENLGFHKDRVSKDFAIVKLDEFSLWLVNQAGAKDNEQFENEALAEHKGAGLYIYIATENIDGYYHGLVDKGLRPSSKPHDWPWGTREFVLRDPDGYKLCFYHDLKGV